MPPVGTGTVRLLTPPSTSIQRPTVAARQSNDPALLKRLQAQGTPVTPQQQPQVASSSPRFDALMKPTKPSEFMAGVQAIPTPAPAQRIQRPMLTLTDAPATENNTPEKVAGNERMAAQLTRKPSSTISRPSAIDIALPSPQTIGTSRLRRPDIAKN
jgi:hypothetical protein